MQFLPAFPKFLIPKFLIPTNVLFYFILVAKNSFQNPQLHKLHNKIFLNLCFKIVSYFILLHLLSLLILIKIGSVEL